MHKEFDRIKKDATCSDFMLDLVQIIEWRLLRVKPELRDTIDTVVKEFEQMYKRCCQDTDYCMNRSKTALESPLRMDDIMEVTRTPRPSFDLTATISCVTQQWAQSASDILLQRYRWQITLQLYLKLLYQTMSTTKPSPQKSCPSCSISLPMLSPRMLSGETP